MSTHQQLLYHIVFSTKTRKPYLGDGFREKVFAYMAGIVKELGGFALIIGGYYDHAQLLVRISAKISISEFVGKLKAGTVSPSQKNRVADYIANQMEHHTKEPFEEEYLLQKHGVDYDQQYVFG